MDAYEDGICVSVGELRALLQRDEEVGEARAPDLVAIFLEELFRTQNDIERRIFLFAERSGRSTVNPAMARIENYCAHGSRILDFLRTQDRLDDLDDVHRRNQRAAILCTVGKQRAYLTPLM